MTGESVRAPFPARTLSLGYRKPDKHQILSSRFLTHIYSLEFRDQTSPLWSLPFWNSCFLGHKWSTYEHKLPVTYCLPGTRYLHPLAETLGTGIYFINPTWTLMLISDSFFPSIMVLIEEPEAAILESLRAKFPSSSQNILNTLWNGQQVLTCFCKRKRTLTRVIGPERAKNQY